MEILEVQTRRRTGGVLLLLTSLFTMIDSQSAFAAPRVVQKGGRNGYEQRTKGEHETLSTQDLPSSDQRSITDGNGPEKWPLKSSLPLTNLHEAWVLGNGDLAALVTFSPAEVCFQLGKSDLWDARFDAVTKDWVLKQDDLIRYVKEFGMTWPGSSWPLSADKPTWPGKRPDGIPEYHDQPPAFDQVRYRPGPKPAGRLRLCIEGMADARIDASLDLARACLSLRIIREESTVHIEAFIERERNVLWVQVQTDKYGGFAELNLEKVPDSQDPDMPAPALRSLGERLVCVSQTIPAGCDVGPFTWSLCGHFPSLAGRPPGGECGVRNVAGAWSFSQRTTLLPKTPLRMAVGVATSREGSRSDVQTRAAALVAEAPDKGFAAARKRHEAAWAGFWRATQIDLDDEIMQPAWHRDLYNLACCHAPHIQAPGLVANIPFTDRSPWHGDYHWNMNLGKMYSPSLPCGHPEWLDSYAALIEQQLPTFEYLAGLIFDLPGAYVDHINFAYTPPQRAMIHNRWGRSLSLTGLTVRPLWERWEYTRDVNWLRRIYPFLRGAAVFYSAYMDKYLDSMGGIGPSMWLEGPGWQPDFEGNINLAPDLIYFRKVLLWAAEAADKLEQDGEFMGRWKANAARVPVIQYGTDDNGPWVERPGLLCARYVAAQEYVFGDEPDGLAAHLRTMTGDAAEQQAKASRHMSHGMIGLVRLQPRLAYDVFRKLMEDSRQPSGQTGVSGGRTPTQWRAPEDHWLATRGIAELLLQSQGGVIRLFPGWPPDRAARFSGLLARDGFVVNAEQDAHGRISARIRSTVGRPCRLRLAQGQLLNVTCRDQPVPTTTAGRETTFKTEAGQDYDVSYSRGE
jgi:hypothetical protein